MGKKTYGLAAVALVVLATLAFIGASGAGAARNGKGLSKHDRALVAEAKASGESTVTLVIATARGDASAVITRLQGLGGSIVEGSDKYGFVVVSVPVDRAVTAAKVAGVLAANVDAPDPTVVPSPEQTQSGTPNLPGLTPINAYMPTGAIGAPQFVAAHPTWDGRGVTVGIVDTGVDVDRPELQTAKNLAGQTVPKIVDWATDTSPRFGDPANQDSTWVPMTAVTPDADGNYVLGGVKYHAPIDAAGAGAVFKAGVFNEGDPRLGGELGSDVNRDGDSNDTFAVVEDTNTHRVWVDTNQNNNLNDEVSMRDYKVDHDVNHFGKDNSSTKGVVETVPFVVQTFRTLCSSAGLPCSTGQQTAFVNIGIVSGGHGTHVAGTVAGNGFFGGKFDGVAPNAQLAVARVCLFITGCFTSDQIRAFEYLIDVDHVDAIQMSIGGLEGLNDGQDAEETIVNNMTAASGVQFFFSQGNSGPGANTNGSPGSADSVLGAGAYQSKDTWAANYGSNVPKDDTMWTFSSRGPREDGGLKPDIVAPGSELSTWPAWNLSEAPPVGARVYSLPPGYEMIQGTSMASPMVAGAGALLLSAAKQSGLSVTPAQLREAIKSGARFIPAYGAYEQGNGLVNVSAAWDVLKTNPTTETITSSAPVNTVLSGQLGTPNSGVGLYEREGWSAGQSGTRTITFTRGNDGPAGTVTYAVGWKGNDGTFSSASSIAIAKGGTASLAVNVNAATAGIHSAIVTLNDPSSAGVEYATEATIIAAQQPDTTNNFAVSGSSDSVDRADKKSYFVHVGPNVSGLKIDETITTGRTRLDLIDPQGVPLVLTGAGPCGCVEDFATAPNSKTVSIQNPMEGVWEIDIEASRSAPASESNTSFTASELGVDITPSTWTVDNAAVGTTYNQAFSFHNRLGAFNGSAVGTTLGSAFKERSSANTADTGSDQQHQINVPAGATSLHVQTSNASQPNTDVDVFLFNCTTGTCVLAGQSAGSTANESVTVANPAAGVWIADVNLFAIPADGTQFDYSDVFTKAGLGQVTTDDVAAAHPSNSDWNANASATAGGVAGAGRILQGFVQVMAGSVIAGQAEVDLTNVH